MDSTVAHHRIETATSRDTDRLLAVLALAFSADPIIRYWFPEPHVFLEYFPRFAVAYGGPAIEHGTAHVAEGFCGAALWLPPGVDPDEEAVGRVTEEAIEEAKLPELERFVEQMEGYRPDEPHWYLPLVGVDPAHQREGIGAALVEPALALCDSEKYPAYLEATSPLSIPLYERFGFERMGEIQAGKSPVLVPMLREPRD
jgi:GNAT superfamily N-acetyltransferase